MFDFLTQATFFGAAISIAFYELGVLIKKKFKCAVFNPLLISIVFTVLVLLVGNIDYEKYNEGAKYISYFLTPATVCLAIPLYEQVELLEKCQGDNRRNNCRCAFQRADRIVSCALV